MFKDILGIAVAIAIINFPCAANAGSAADTAVATFTVLKQCTLTTSDLDLGTYSIDQTWDSVGNVHGKYNGTAYTSGSADPIKFGVVTCDLGMPYTIQIVCSSTTSEKGATLIHAGKTMIMLPTVKKIGTIDLDDNNGWSNAGADVSSKAVSGTGSGVGQDIVGTLTLLMVSGKSSANPSDKLGDPGVISDTLKYTLSF